jgi:hypothetical protein
MTDPSLAEKILAIHAALGEDRIPHAFGGALALAYYAEPRATVDVDLNAFVPPNEHERVFKALAPLGVTNGDPQAAERDAQVRWWWGDNPIDVFFAHDAIHEAMRNSARTVPFGEDRIPILAPEHLIVCKVAFDRPKDWLDIEQMLLLEGDLDMQAALTWLGRILPDGDPRLARLRALAEIGNDLDGH